MHLRTESSDIDLSRSLLLVDEESGQRIAFSLLGLRCVHAAFLSFFFLAFPSCDGVDVWGRGIIDSSRGTHGWMGGFGVIPEYWNQRLSQGFLEKHVDVIVRFFLLNNQSCLANGSKS